MSEKKIDLILEKLEVINLDITSLKEGQDRLESKVTNLEQGQDRLESKVTNLEQGQANLEQGQAKLENRMSNLEDRLTGLEFDFQSFKSDNLALHQYTQRQIDQAFQKLSMLVDHEVRIETLEHRPILHNGK